MATVIKRIFGPKDPKATAKIYPTSDPKWPIWGDILTLPLTPSPLDLITVSWSEDKYEVSKRYYQMRAWYNRPPAGTTDEDFNKAYETARECKIFVAEEFIDPRYRFGPPMADQHLLNATRSQIGLKGEPEILSLDDVMKADAAASDDSPGHQGWARLTIDEHFYYGQSADVEKPDRRWLVYHPCREAFQGRFVKDSKQRNFETVASVLPEVSAFGFTLVKMDAIKAKALGLLLLKAGGDPLRQFVPPEVNKAVLANKDLAAINKVNKVLPERASTLYIEK
ncbi:uncharacterized protein RCC_02123 [Ramularia collo-cygni]|uniref:Uncharacterized protein n=1 Tax=Ramularia collo-cygni TaxID=112498 RepID=A0A2D3UNC5_9PEZI|nr:uncharacterized protein RCC_02123 [Ramularia collo-cygni]CZT16281.1 uncharacterized protein RCC_02123 [Ramularia collo-cygni]